MESISSIFYSLDTMPIIGIVYLVLCVVLFSGFIIMPLWALKLYVQNRRLEKSLRGEGQGTITVGGSEVEMAKPLTPSWTGK
ncbi:MAG: hypothetical protein PVF76_16140 [Syntrophobacterales bacterium]|jgi:hypothetical protein